MSLTILSVAYPLTPVGPNSSGGSEQVLCLLDRILTEKGHRSLVIAVQGSQVQGELIPSPRAAGPLNDEVRRWGRRAHQSLLLETLNRYSVDLVHMHSLDFHSYLPASSIPILATLHLPVDWYPEQIFLSQRKNFFLNCVSGSQQKQCPPCADMLPFIGNGIDVRSFDWNGKREPFVLSLGRICPEKGFHLALEAAHQADVPMILAGELFPYEHHLSYFHQEIKPRLDKKRQFIGPVGGEKKRKLLASARGLLLSSLVAETSSLVTMEALASGTPVVAFPAGAVPELVVEGKTGFLVENVEEMAGAIRRLSDLDAASCRKAAERKCDFREMGRQYLERYETILQTAAQCGTSASRERVSWLADVS